MWKSWAKAKKAFCPISESSKWLNPRVQQDKSPEGSKEQGEEGAQKALPHLQAQRKEPTQTDAHLHTGRVTRLLL